MKIVSKRKAIELLKKGVRVGGFISPAGWGRNGSGDIQQDAADDW